MRRENLSATWDKNISCEGNISLVSSAADNALCAGTNNNLVNSSIEEYGLREGTIKNRVRLPATRTTPVNT